MIIFTPILLVEDNPDDVLFMHRASKRVEISRPIHVAPDGQAAIDYLSNSGEYSDKAKYPTPCLVLLDLKLPYKNGLEVLKWIRSRPDLKTLPVLMFTTSGESADVEEAYHLGANGYLVKPANMNELVNLVQSVKTFWLQHNLLPSVSMGRTPMVPRVERL